jgi:hypothetical protein
MFVFEGLAEKSMKKYFIKSKINFFLKNHIILKKSIILLNYIKLKN